MRSQGRDGQGQLCKLLRNEQRFPAERDWLEAATRIPSTTTNLEEIGKLKELILSVLDGNKFPRFKGGTEMVADLNGNGSEMKVTSVKA